MQLNPKKGMDEAQLMETEEGIVLFHPQIPASAIERVSKVLPLHPKMKLEDVTYITNVIKSGW